MSLRVFWGGLLGLLMGTTMASAQNTQAPVVLELFTSQSCSSCPPADALMKQIAASDLNAIVLSYHVDYWDYLSWKDTYSSPANTQRQHNYAQALNSDQVFTPQLIVNGTASAVGANQGDVAQAMAQAKRLPFAVTIKPVGQQLAVTIIPQGKTLPPAADILAVQFDHYAKTQVKAGENGGRTLEIINNVTGIKNLGSWSPQNNQPIVMDTPPDGVAILVQTPQQGAILGAALFNTH